MSRRSMRSRKAISKTMNPENVFRPGLQNKRNEALKEDQEIEIQSKGHHQQLTKTLGKCLSKQSLQCREGSHDSAISSDSTQYSVSSSVSLVSTITRSMTKKLQAIERLSSVPEETPGPHYHKSSKRKNVSHDTLTWIKKLPDTPNGTNFNDNYMTTNVEKKETRELDIICQKCVFQGTNYKHESLVYFHVFTFTILYNLTRESINASLNKNGSAVPIDLTLAQHLIVQSLVYICLGVIADILHCSASILIPQIVLLFANISILYNCIPLGIIKIMLSFSSGIMGWQLTLIKRHRTSNASVLSRLSFIYSLAFILQPTLTHAGHQLLGHYFFRVLLPVVCCASLIAVMYYIPSNDVHLSSNYGVQWQKLIGYIVIKMLSTAPIPLILLAMQSILSKSMSAAFTVGTHLVPVLVVPVICLCTKISTGITGLGLILILFYILLIWIDSMEQLVSMLVPISGLFAIHQNFILSTLISTAPLYMGIVCAVNLVLHTFLKYLMPMTLSYLEYLCSISEIDNVFVWRLSVNSTLYNKEESHSSAIENLLIFLEETLISFDFKKLACKNLLKHTITLTGFICSCVMLFVSRCLG